MEPKQYHTATAFRRALEDRLKTISHKQGIDLQRLRRQVAFDRLLARFFKNEEPPWALKGGYAMELRIDSARTTRDLDLTIRGNKPSVYSKKPKERNEAILQMLQEHAAIDLSDFFVFNIGQAMSDLDAPLYGGARFPVESRMDGRLFASFHLDAAVGDIVMDPVETIEGKDWLKFAGIPRAKPQMICREQQFAEKLHAYTLPRQNPNSRVRDLVDMVLLIESSTLAKHRVADAIRMTFERRKTHEVPKELISPPPDWTKPFAAMAKECSLKEDIDQAFATLKSFTADI